MIALRVASCGSPAGVNAHAPVASAIVVPRRVEPSVKVIFAFASAVPTRAGIEVWKRRRSECNDVIEGDMD